MNKNRRYNGRHEKKGKSTNVSICSPIQGLVVNVKQTYVSKYVFSFQTLNLN